MQNEVKVPDIGDYKDVEVIEVLVNPGDSIEQEDPLITLETDKATMEIPSPVAGTVAKITVKVGDRVSKDTVIALVEVAGQEKETKPETKSATTENSSSVKADKPKAEQPKKSSKKSAAKAIKPIIIPDLGTDGAVEVIEVAISIGDNVEKDAPLVTLESDKASMDIPAECDGKITELKLKVGDKVKTGDVLGAIETAGDGESDVADEVVEQPSAESKSYSTKVDTQASTQQSTKSQDLPKSVGVSTTSGSVHASPAVRRFARELGVDLTNVSGTGQKGRITKLDVSGFVKKVMQSGANPAASGGGSGLNVAAMPEIDFSKFGEVETQPLSRIKKLSGSFLHRNWVTIPHVTQFDEADITELEDFRKKQKALAEKQGIKLTPLAFMMKAVVAGLKQFPLFNSSLAANGSDLIVKKYYHIGVAVDTPNGLVVPVVRDVDKKGLFQLAAELAEISVKARDGKLKATDMQGGCFSISSLGGIGGTAFTPIVNAPDVAILGVSRSVIKPVYTDGEFKPRLMLPLSLSYDHRVIDGADGARFTKFLVNQLSDIRRLLL